jgi:alpha/beta superfamily hydrolase
MQNKAFSFGPVALAASAANVLNPPTASGGVNAGSSPNYIIVKHMRFVNTTGAAITLSGYLGATGASAAGTEVVGIGKSVPANDYLDWFGQMRIDSTQFLVMFGSAVGLTVQGSGEIGVAG